VKQHTENCAEFGSTNDDLLCDIVLYRKRLSDAYQSTSNQAKVIPVGHIQVFANVTGTLSCFRRCFGPGPQQHSAVMKISINMLALTRTGSLPKH